MPIAFFVSSLGDTNLAKATITTLLKQKTDQIYVIPVTSTAEAQLKDFVHDKLKVFPLTEIIQQSSLSNSKALPDNDIEKVRAFIFANKIEHAYIGVPSPVDEEIPYQIARALNIPCTIAYEYMFSAPAEHRFWHHFKEIAKPDTHFVVPLTQAAEELKKLNSKVDTHVVGHLSIDKAMSPDTVNIHDVRHALKVADHDELVFVSGTTQPLDIDKAFISALLAEIATGQYPHIQIRIGLHPGRKDMNAYLTELSSSCARYPDIHKQVKFILPENISKNLDPSLNLDSNFILRADIKGDDAASAADRIAQAVPGALLNTGAIKGKPSYFHVKSSNPYLPESWFAQNISGFFKAKKTPVHTQEELGLKDTAPNLLAALMTRKTPK